MTDFFFLSFRPFRQFRRRRRLRKLQRDYYEATSKNDAVIVDYLRALAETRDEELASYDRSSKPRALHVGSGGHYLRGWTNTDFEFSGPVDLIMDATTVLPFRSSSFDYIHSEDFLEHIDIQAGKRFLGEAYRVLKPGGVMRLLTPDLQSLVRHVYFNRERHHLHWCQSYLAADGPCEALNMHLRMDGEHRFIYDEEFLTTLLAHAGFSVRRVGYNASPDPFLRYLDLRDFGLNLFLEAQKPGDAH